MPLVTLAALGVTLKLPACATPVLLAVWVTEPMVSDPTKAVFE